MSLLFSALKIKNIQLKNRIAVSPMCQYSGENGFANDWHLVHLGSRAIGGAGLIIQEATAVSPEGRISPYDLGIWTDEHIHFLKRITSFIQQNGSVAGIQLAHAGRKASFDSPWTGGKQLLPTEGGWTTFAPSAIPYKEEYEKPLALSLEGIEQVKSDFKAATKRCIEAGYQLLELHAAHGYLLHQFLSPLTNQRTDNYGGDFKNRTRFVMEVVAAVQEVWPSENPLFVRISATDWAEGGWTSQESIELAQRLKEMGVDLIDCSSGGNVPTQKIPVGPGYQVPFATSIKKETGILTAAVGLITDAVQAEAILNEGKADLIVMARELLRDPYFPIHAADTLEEKAQWPLQYERAATTKKH